MSFLVYFLALIFAAGAAVFGLDMVTAPLPDHKPAAAAISASSKPNKVAKRAAEAAQHDTAANKVLTPVYPANPGGVREVTADKGADTGTSGAAASRETAEVPAQPIVTAEVPEPPQKPAAMDKPQATPVAQTAIVEPPGAQAVTQQSAGHCEAQACANAYRSFRASDCSYQPFDGPRRACVAPPMTQARNDTALERASRQTARAAMAPANGPRFEELRRSQDDEYDDEDDDDDASAYAPMDRSVIIIRRPPGW